MESGSSSASSSGKEIPSSYHKTSSTITFIFLISILQKSKSEIISWLQSLFLLGTTYICPKCDQLMSLKPVPSSVCSDMVMWKCSRTIDGSRHQISRSIRRGTFFDHSNLRLEEIIQFIYFWSLDYPCKLILHEMKQVGWSSLVDWSNFCREVCIYLFMSNPQMIGGPGKIIEIDESKFGKWKYNRGRMVEGQWVFGGVEHESGDCFLLPGEDRSASTLIPFILKSVRPTYGIPQHAILNYFFIL